MNDDRFLGYFGKAVVVVSCVTKDLTYRPHPHSLVGRERYKNGVCTLEIKNENMTCTFSNFGIQCVKKKVIEAALKLHEEMLVDPFQSTFFSSFHFMLPTSQNKTKHLLNYEMYFCGHIILMNYNFGIDLDSHSQRK